MNCCEIVYLLQEELLPNRWKMIVGCILLNQTTRTQVDQVIGNLFKKWPDALEMQNADPDEIAETIKRCGLQNRRARSLIKFSQQWTDLPSDTPIKNYYGVGKYAEDSWDIFVEGKWRKEKVTDKELKRYQIYRQSLQN